MVNRRRRSQIPPASPSPSTAELRTKLTKLVSRHEEVKITFHQLKHQIRAGLLEAEEVVTSLAIPLMKLVGLKTVEMAEEGRFTRIIIDNDIPREQYRNPTVSESPLVSAVDSADKSSQISVFQAEKYATKAFMTVKELSNKQETRFMQLVYLLKQIETQVNSRQDDILQAFGNHKNSLKKLFQKSINILSNFHSQDRDTIIITMKLLQALFNNVGAVFSSIEDGVGDLMLDLAKSMCNPMMEYAKGLKVDMKGEMFAYLLVIVEEMEREIQNGRHELDAAKKKAIVAEQEKMKALSKLRETEERLRRSNEHHGFFVEAQKKIIEPFAQHVLFSTEEIQAKGDMQTKHLLQKRKTRTPASPFGPNELLYCQTNNKQHKPSGSGTTPLISHVPVTRSHSRGLVPLIPFKNGRTRLRSSPT